MKKNILAVVILSFLSCKKDDTTTNAETTKDTISSKNINKDTITKKIDSEIFAFQTELCDNKGFFDANKYSKDELDGTFKLWFQHGGISLETPFVNDLGDLEEVRRDNAKILAKLDENFAKSKRTLENLKVVKIPYWQNLKKTISVELQQDYDKQKIQIESYINPSVLLSSKIGSKCTNFAKALNGTDDEIKAEWRKLREAMSKKNSDPSSVMNDLENRMNSSHWKEYATIDLTSFGWGNCANDAITRISQDENMQKEYEKLFLKLEQECDEP